MSSSICSGRFGYACDDWLNTEDSRFGCFSKARLVQDNRNSGFGSRIDLIGSGDPIRSESAPPDRSVYFSLLSHSLFRPEPTFSFLSIFPKNETRADSLSLLFLFAPSSSTRTDSSLSPHSSSLSSFPIYSQTSPLYHQSHR